MSATKPEKCEDCGSKALIFAYNVWTCQKCKDTKEENERKRNVDEERSVESSDNEVSISDLIDDSSCSRDVDWRLTVGLDKVDAKCTDCKRMGKYFLSSAVRFTLSTEHVSVYETYDNQYMCLECLCNWEPIAQWYSARDKKRESKRLKTN